MLVSHLKKIAVTGGLSCGKSTVCRIFKELGAYVVSADEVVHQLLSSPSVLSRQVVDLFGSDIIVNGQIDRSKIAKIAFRQATSLKSLEELLHPAVRDEIEMQYQLAASNPKYPLFIAEIPLLFETGAEKFYDATIAVVAQRDPCIQRFVKSTGQSKTEFDRRMARQLSQEEKAARANYVIVNDSNLTDLHSAVCDLFEKL
ncbi:MAG: dephospho-CoA kinase [Parachlamydiaceae bacterium]|nr:dephospho-CoA kinase [Parachlamydiaceae bacterium]